jgi:hypothetical protein
MVKTKSDKYKEWYDKGGKDWTRNYNLKRKYGISLVEYKRLLKRQKNKCAICKKDQKDEKKFFAVDHNHKTGMIRGILCSYCNSKVLKYLRDDKNKSIGLVKYLIKALKEDKKWTTL